ncbi:aminoglycoside phosphotransferase family protein [Sinomonas sp. ASV322]|uniref:aminoglycoside phosphotransferase family protein n=1 Tax=Sinomonas sp. ASV322 TaxID=3041920 RepID=UPI0027DEA0F6|nr:aminoglycoside phosphotransferase family protein [Sinomonas sp. ASV322]MDQ4502620.1 aminoglycoside phosphotransferase family protein [Sinomonas sp. ASV322]
MASSALDVLTPQQVRLLNHWLGEWTVEEDMSWGVQAIHVLRLRTARGLVVAKASTASHHIQRELRAHRQMTAPLGSHAPRLLHGDSSVGLVVTAWLPGQLVEGGPFEFAPETFEQAGRLLALFHVPRHETASYDPAALHKIGDFADRAVDLVPPDHLRGLLELVEAHRPAPRVLYATHGDYQPRNWVEDGGQVSVIDFGRAGYRPWVTDLVRLEHRYFASDARHRGPTHDGAALRAAFYAGYGRDPAEEPDSWRLDNILQALGTVVWSHDVGDAVFEDAGRQMIIRILEDFGTSELLRRTPHDE